MVNGWTRNVRTNRAKITATSPAWVYSKKNRLGFREMAMLRSPPRAQIMGRIAAGFQGEAWRAPVLFDLEERQEGLLGDVHPPDLLHPLLSLLLLLQELALAGDVPAVALRQDVLAH